MNEKYFEDKEVLILGGSGSLGKAITKLLITKYNPKGIRIFSRDEYKQWQMKKIFGGYRIAYLIGNIRDKERLSRAMNNTNIVINCAALKHITICENDPFEAKKTNIDGVENVINAAIDNKIETIMHISTDKAANPVNLYGMTKAVGEKLIIKGNTYRANKTKMSCCRYGNVFGSRGSIIELFYNQIKENNSITITDKDMTRFWIELQDVAKFILDNIQNTIGGEIFIPKMPSMKVLDIAHAIDCACKIEIIGMSRGEKLHECLVTTEESYYTKILKNKYIIDYNYYNPVPFTYTSKENYLWLTINDIKEKLQRYKNENL